MSSPDDVVDRLRKLDRGRLAYFSACAAVRMSPVYRSFGRAASQPRFEGWLQELWATVIAVSAARARRLHEAVEAAPEAWVDDSHLPEFSAMRALSVLDYAALVCFEAEPAECALMCSRAARELLADFDFMLARGSFLADAERAAQREVLERIETDEDEWTPRRDEYRSPIEDLLRTALPLVARARGWALEGR